MKTDIYLHNTTLTSFGDPGAHITIALFLFWVKCLSNGLSPVQHIQCLLVCHLKLIHINWQRKIKLSVWSMRESDPDSVWLLWPNWVLLVLWKIAIFDHFRDEYCPTSDLSAIQRGSHEMSCSSVLAVFENYSDFVFHWLQIVFHLKMTGTVTSSSL